MNDDGDLVQCVLCGHKFHPGVVDGYIYCSACGRRFHPDLAADDTVAISPPIHGQEIENGKGKGKIKSLLDEDSGDIPTSASRRFGSYDIVDEIARGGMGVVYLARQRVLRRVVALKVLRSGDNASEEERQRLLREAKAAAGLSHPNIVPIHEFSIHQGQPYFTMDYIDGKPLDQLLEKGPLNVREAVNIIATVSRAISYAHGRGIIHRDLTPANIILAPDGRPMITDFGLAVEQCSNQNDRMTMAGAIMGTIPYAPPEQAAGKIDQISERSDVYSMGAVLYEMVTGRPPFTGFTQFELMRRVINHDPTPPRAINPKVHRDVETIILKCLEKEQRRRYSTAKAFADDCQSFLKGEVIAARPVTLGYRCKRFITRRPLMNLLGAMVLGLSLAVWIGITHFRVLAKEKENTEIQLSEERERSERIAQEKAEADRQVRRDWRTEYNFKFDYYFPWESDIEASRRQGIPWLNPANTRNLQVRPRVKLLADPPRLLLFDPESRGAGPETPYEGETDLGLPFSFPREVRIAIRFMTPAEGEGAKVGELILSLDVDKDYLPHIGTTTLRMGSPGHPGASIYRSGAIVGENPAFQLKPSSTCELVLERSDDRIRAYLDGMTVLESDDPPPVFNKDPGRMTLDVKDGGLEFLDLAVDLRGMSRNLAASLIEQANGMAARGRSELAYRLYMSVLSEATDPQTRLRALRGYARSLWLTLKKNERTPAGIEKACQELNEHMGLAGRARPGEIDYVVGLVLASNQLDSGQALERLDRATAVAYSAGGEAAGEYGDLARLEALFVYLRRGMLTEAARKFNIMFEDGAMTRLYERFGPELGGGGQVAFLLEKAEPLIQTGDDLDTAATLLRAAATIAPSSRECANQFRRLGRRHANLGHFEKGVEFMHWAERLSPDWFRPYLDEARIHFESGASALAENALERAAAAIPQSLDLRLGIARMYLEELPDHLQDAEKAVVAAQAAVNLSQRNNAVALELLAEGLFRSGHYVPAFNAVADAIRIESTESRTHLREAISLELFKKDGEQRQ